RGPGRLAGQAPLELPQIPSRWRGPAGGLVLHHHPARRPAAPQGRGRPVRERPVMTLLDYALLVGAGIVGGGVNAIAGGGTFFTFPAFMAVGLDPLTANASNAVAIYPGHAGAVPAYRAELAALPRALL